MPRMLTKHSLAIRPLSTNLNSSMEPCLYVLAQTLPSSTIKPKHANAWNKTRSLLGILVNALQDMIGMKHIVYHALIPARFVQRMEPVIHARRAIL